MSTTWPSNSSVPIARTSQSTARRAYTPVAAGRRTERESTRYCTTLAQASTTASHNAKWENVSLDGQATGINRSATVRNSTSVLAFATRRAGTLTPRRATTTPVRSDDHLTDGQQCHRHPGDLAQGSHGR